MPPQRISSKITQIPPSPLAGEGRVRENPNFHPHPLNHVRFRALSCTLRGAGLILPHRAAQALSAASKGEEIRLRIFIVQGVDPRATGYQFLDRMC